MTQDVKINFKDLVTNIVGLKWQFTEHVNSTASNQFSLLIILKLSTTY